MSTAREDLPSLGHRRASQPSGEQQQPISEPEAVHLRHEASTIADKSGDEREAVDLRTPAEQRIAKQQRLSRVLSEGRPHLHWWDYVTKLWRHNIRLSVPHVDCRDHLANERTYLAYLRTSVALSMLGTVIAQLYRLSSPPSSPAQQVFSYFAVSKPIAAVFQCSAIAMILLGAIRFYRQQGAMSVGKVHAGGWEIGCVILMSCLLLVGLFALHVALDVYNEDD